MKSNKGIVLSYMGFCEMVLEANKCPKCETSTSAEGHSEGLVILNSCTAASISLVRHFCHEVAAERDAFAKVFRSWWIKARGRSLAGIFARMSQSRSRRTVSRVLSVGLRLMRSDIPDWSFNCEECCDKGRYKVVTADGIWLCYLRRLVTNYYQQNEDRCVPDAELLKAGIIIASESVRRFLRLCITHPAQVVHVGMDHRKAFLRALSVICPAALPVADLHTTIANEPAVFRARAMLKSVWHVPMCSVQLSEGLLAATTRFSNAAAAANRREAETSFERRLYVSLRACLITPQEANGLPAAAAGGVVGPDIVGVVPMAPTGRSHGHLPNVAALPANISPGLVAFCVALVVDPVVAPFTPTYCADLRRLASELRAPTVAARMEELSL